MQYVIEFIGALALLIVVHELGHFLACRLFKVPVEEFGIGLPPKALTIFRAGGTEFTLNWIPLGGFVRPRGESDPQLADGLAAAKPGVRIGVALAGPLANILMVAFLYTVLIGLIGEPDPARLDEVQVQAVLPGSPAQMAGLQEGDFLLALNGQEIRSVEEARAIIYANLDQPVLVRYQRGESVAEVSLTPLSSRPPEQGATGVQLGTPMRSVSLVKAVWGGVEATYLHSVFLVKMVGRLITGQAVGPGGVVGPIGMGRMYVGMREASPSQGLIPILDVLAFLINVSLSLAFFNFLPIPALDGGRIVLALPELIFRRRLQTRVENWLITFTFLVLLGFLIFISLRDIFFPIEILP